MIFPQLELESTVQTNDKTRLDASKSFITPDESSVTLIEIEPEASAGFINVTSLKYLDWQYSTDGTKTVTVQVTTDGVPASFSKAITVVTAAVDKLFSFDTDLTAHEPDILKYVRDGRNSFIDIHRQSQAMILAWLDEKRIWDFSGNRLTKDNITDIQEVREWSKYMTLRLIFEGLSNAVDDVFADKAKLYKALEEMASNRSALRLDLDGNENTVENKIDMRSIPIGRR